MVMNSFKLSESDMKLLNDFMKDNNIKNKSLAIRECIKIATEKDDLKSFMFEQNNKSNRMLHNIFVIKKLLEQHFVNTGFAQNIELEKDECLKKFYDKYNSYKNNFLG